MTRDEALRKATAALTLLDTFPASMCDHAATPCTACDSHRATVEILRRCFREIAPASSRLEAAERAVVEAALALLTQREPPFRWNDLFDAVTRLRALREQAQAEECGAGARGDAAPPLFRQVRCTLPRGHEGAHRGNLGEWSWE